MTANETTTIAPVSHDVVLHHTPDRVWDKIFDGEAARGWLGVAGFVMPERQGAAFCWFYDAGPTMPSADVGRITALQRPERLTLLLRLAQSQVDSRVTLLLTRTDNGHTALRLTHAGFPDDRIGRFERDGWEHGWEHHLELLADHLDGRANNYQIGHRAVLGVVPVGVTEGDGILVSKVRSGSPADLAGVRPGDVIRSADQVVFDSMEDFDEWIDDRRPGDQVILRVGDRSLAAVLEAKQPPEYLANV
ncbi:hypothetical protein DL990_13655 [Amycolatopsis sp. WAC 01416]|uniref:SRPBCC domain-containing protein n=1 Tax=Amycolatopsis sp. WAC 01416 TaxID=2203196 RepID=UPI000F7B6950|nr:SRPBCC domain-containing protein [Amycolatopsis sp. WAC 01416]RSN34676.1 hypothetical protein DL990_13655 [Amycolatopsis sp. WAC 01416]